MVNLDGHMKKLAGHAEYQHYQILLQVSFKNNLEAVSH